MKRVTARRQRGAQAVERQALAELEHRVDVALARVRQEEHVAAATAGGCPLAVAAGVGTHGRAFAG